MSRNFLAAYGHCSTPDNVRACIAEHYEEAAQLRQISDPGRWNLIVTTGDAEGWDKDAAGNTVPPYYKFFADQIGSIFVPIVIRLAVHVDQGYEGYPKIRKATKEVRGDSYILAPKPKGPKPEEVTQLQNPSAEAGKPVSVPFGTVWVQEVNILWYGDKDSKTYKVRT